jgi:hypothetical protein
MRKKHIAAQSAKDDIIIRHETDIREEKPNIASANIMPLYPNSRIIDVTENEIKKPRTQTAAGTQKTPRAVNPRKNTITGYLK